MKRILILGLMMLTIAASAQRQAEHLKHGLVAVKASEGILVSWRILASEHGTLSYNLYRDGVKINEEAIEGKSNYIDATGTAGASYELRILFDGIETATGEQCIAWEKSYIDIPVQDINGSFSTHTINDASVGDLDGDGEYEIIVKRVALDVSLESPDNHLLEAYELDGTFLWRIDIGPNLVNDKEFNFLVWDLDGDGKAEIALRTSEGFIDGIGNQIGDVDGDYITNYRAYVTSQQFRYKGPDFFSVLDGETGEEIARTDYIPREPISQWGLPGQNTTQLAHRSTKCMFTVAYLDGKIPSVVFGRGIYEKIALTAYNFRDGELEQLWYFDSDQPEHIEYNKEGFHNLTQGDVDNDGRDEIMYGSMCVDDDGTGLYTTNLGHGDAQHLTDINPDWPGLEYFGCLENSTGGIYRNAGSGEYYYYQSIGRDMGRAGCSDITPNYPGMEMWGATGFKFLSAAGKEITNLPPPSSMNFFIWWDGDPIREMLDHDFNSSTGVGIGTITKYNNGANTRLLEASGTRSNNWSKGTPCVSVDILGDWREEVIWRSSGNDAMRLYLTNTPSDHGFYTLMQDHQYRAAIGWQQNSYNQPPHPSFFIGHDMDSIPPSNFMLPGQKTWISGTWDKNVSSNWDMNGTSQTFEDGDSVLFDISCTQENVNIAGTMSPSDIRIISPNDIVFDGNGTISGEANLTKDLLGKLSIKNTNTYTGITRIWDGELCLSGSLDSKVLVKRFATLSGNGILNNGVSIEKLGHLSVGESVNIQDTLHILGTLSFETGSNLHMDLSSDPDGETTSNDIIKVSGALHVNGELEIHIHLTEGVLSVGEYTLIDFSEGFYGDIESIHTVGLESLAHRLRVESGKLILEIPETRPATTIIWEGSIDNEWDIFNKQNWLNNGTSDVFIGNDTVIFNDAAKETNISIVGNYAVSQLIYDGSTKITIEGEGGIAGEASVLKKGSGTLRLNSANTYTGVTRIEDGVLEVPELGNAGAASGLGAASDDPANLVLDGGTLKQIETGTKSSNRGITVAENNGAIYIPAGASLNLYSPLTGDGKLEKTGLGTLIMNDNMHGGTIITEGEVKLNDEDANYNGLGDSVFFKGGTLQMYDNYNSYTDNVPWHIVVEEGQNGWLNLDGRCLLGGSLTGAGNLNIKIPYVRSIIAGDWSEFDGEITPYTDNDGAPFFVNNDYGLGSASVQLTEGISMMYWDSENASFEIGELSGSANSYLSAGGQGSNTMTWIVGGKNTNAVFDGLINEAQVKNDGAKTAIVKTGSGTWTLTNANVYNGGTLVNQGSLILANTEGSATGTGDVLVKETGMITGTGTMSGNLKLEDEAALSPDHLGVGFLNIGGNLELSDATTVWIDVDTESNLADYVNVGGSLKLNGTLFMNRVSSPKYEENDAFQLFLASKSISGSFDKIYPKTPGDGLEWDTTYMDMGYLRVVEATVPVDTSNTDTTAVLNQRFSQLVHTYPNPFRDRLNILFPEQVDAQNIHLYSMEGKEMKIEKSISSGFKYELHTSHLNKGSYILVINEKPNKIHRAILIKY